MLTLGLVKAAHCGKSFRDCSGEPRLIWNLHGSFLFDSDAPKPLELLVFGEGTWVHNFKKNMAKQLGRMTWPTHYQDKNTTHFICCKC